jgi:flagellar M-ring protein FliF
LASLATGAAAQVQEAWGRLKPTARWTILGLGAALLFAIGIGTYLNRPEWVVLVSQADPKEAAAVVTRLQELKVPYRPTGDGFTILVPKSEQYTAKLALAQAGLPRGASVGMELFDEPKFGATDFDRRVNYLRAQQGELERALLRIAEVEYANVKLAIPERSVFIREQQAVTAAIMVQAKAGRKLTQDQVVGVVNFVAGSVQGLSTENVKVVDQSGRLLSGGVLAAELAQGTDPEQLQRQAVFQRELEQRVQTLLEPVFGSGNVLARVNLELNMEASRIETQTVGEGTPKSTETVRETAQGGAGTTTGGTGDPAGPPVYQGQSSGTGDQWKTRTNTVYELSQRKEVTVVTPGSVKRVSVGIVVNRTDLTLEQIKQIQDTVANATGADTAAISVAAMQFNRESTTPIAVSSPFISSTALIFILGSGALLLIFGYVIVRLRQMRLENSLEPAFAGIPGGAERSRLDVAVGEQSGQPGWEPTGPASGGATAQKLATAMASRRQVEGEQVDEALLLQVDDLIDSNPEACAELLRQWLKGVA